MGLSDRKVEIAVRKNPVNIYKHLLLKAPPLIIGWRTQGVAKLGFKVADFLIEKLGGKIIAEINPIGFFGFEETIFKDNVAQYPECQFWACERDGLLVFK
jgi:proteasome assembly chaperone (PAC2) family protein